MKKLVYNNIASWSLLVVMMAMLVWSCEDDNGVSSPPVITEVRNYAAAPNDTVITSLNDGQWVVLIGKNLGAVNQVYFGSIAANINRTLLTDGTLVVQVPSIPFQTVPKENLHIVSAVGKGGTASFEINITGAPIIARVRNYAASPNDTIARSVVPGQFINIIGYNLEKVTKVSFQGVDSDLSNIVYTDSSAIVKVPDDFSSVDASLANKLVYTTKVGTVTYSIKIFDPAILEKYKDPMWVLLTGGIGNEKTWVLDIDASGISKKFKTALAFVGYEWFWDRDCILEVGDCWIYFPNETQGWMPGPKDYGTMTFKLKGSPPEATLGVEQKGIGSKDGNFSGNYFLDADTKTITFTDIVPLNMGRDVDWSKAYIFSLTEDGMQLAFKHHTKAEYEIYNYISKEFNDSFEPPAPPPANEGFNPKFEPGELLNILTGGVGSARQWQLDVDGNPLNWMTPTDPNGLGWVTNKNSTRDWGWNDTWDAAVENAWIKFDRFNGNQNYTRYQNGVTTTGTFSINETTNEITLTTNTLLVNPGHWMSPSTNTIKVIHASPSDLHNKGLWFGTSYDAGKDEWLVFHYVTM